LHLERDIPQGMEVFRKTPGHMNKANGSHNTIIDKIPAASPISDPAVKNTRKFFCHEFSRKLVKFVAKSFPWSPGKIPWQKILD